MTVTFFTASEREPGTAAFCTQNFNRASFSPRVSQRGEKVPKADEGLWLSLRRYSRVLPVPSVIARVLGARFAAGAAFIIILVSRGMI